MQSRNSFDTDPVNKVIDENNEYFEIANAITAFGLLLKNPGDPDDWTQLSKAIANAVANSTYFIDNGVVNNYILLSPIGTKSMAEYRIGSVIRFLPMNSNTGPSTINVNSLGLVDIKRYDDSALQANDITTDGYCMLIFDGTNFRLLKQNVVITAKLIATNINSDIIMPNTTDGNILLKNSSESTIAKFLNSKFSNFFSVGQFLGEFNPNTTTDIVYSTLNESGILIATLFTDGNSQHDVKMYSYASSALTATINLFSTTSSVARFTLGFLSNSGSPNYNNTLRITSTELSEKGKLYKFVFGINNYGF